MKVPFIIYENFRTGPFWRSVVCEFAATTILIFIGCGSEMLNNPGAVVTTSSDIVRVALAFGFAINILIKTFGPVSGCHVNPAVSIAFMVIGKVSLIRAACYSLAQCLGAIFGALLLFGFRPLSSAGQDTAFLGAPTLKNGISAVQGFGIEATLTFILVLAISACLDEKRVDHGKMRITNPLTIGFSVSALHLAGIPFTGCAINPARAFGPAVVMCSWTGYHWIYWLGPLTGGCLGSSFYYFLISYPQRSNSTDSVEVVRVPLPSARSTLSVSSQIIEVPIESYNNKADTTGSQYLQIPSP